MVHDLDKELDALLSKRAVPEMRSNLEHRIIQASLKQEVHVAGRQSEGGFFAGLKAVLDNIVLPQPALALMMVLMVGGVLGAYSPDVMQEDDVDSFESYIMTSDEIGYGDFL